MKASRAEKKRIHIRKHVSLVTSRGTCKRSRSFKGFASPDNFLALFGCTRVKKPNTATRTGDVSQ